MAAVRAYSRLFVLALAHTSQRREGRRQIGRRGPHPSRVESRPSRLDLEWHEDLEGPARSRQTALTSEALTKSVQRHPYTAGIGVCSQPASQHLGPRSLPVRALERALPSAEARPLDCPTRLARLCTCRGTTRTSAVVFDLVSRSVSSASYCAAAMAGDRRKHTRSRAAGDLRTC